MWRIRLRAMARDGYQLMAGADGHDAGANVAIVRLTRGIARRVVRGGGRLRHPQLSIRVRMTRRVASGIARILLGRVHTFGGNRQRRPMNSEMRLPSQSFRWDTPRRMAMGRRRRSNLDDVPVVVRSAWARRRVGRSDLVREDPRLGALERVEGIGVLLAAHAGGWRDVHTGTR